MGSGVAEKGTSHLQDLPVAAAACATGDVGRELARRRVVVEQVIRGLKIFRIPAERYHNRMKRFSLQFNLSAVLYNYGLSLG
jgi:hypothetical protein